jgi:hypothetical protein
MLAERAVKSDSSERQPQTFNRDVQVQPPEFAHTSSQSSRWDIFDSFHTKPDPNAADQVKKLGKRNTKKSRETHTQISESESFSRALDVMEKAVIQNTMHEKHLLYRGVDDANPREDGSSSGDSGSLKKLWAFSCEMSRGQNVSALEWNKYNKVCCLHLSLCFDNSNHCFGANSAGSAR